MPKRLSRKRTRFLAERVLAVAGVVVVLGAMLTMTRSPLLVGVVVLGLLLIEVGVWRLADPLLPDDRSFLSLRQELDTFLLDIRALNDHAVAGEEDGVARVRERLHEQVEAIFEAAGTRDA